MTNQTLETRSNDNSDYQENERKAFVLQEQNKSSQSDLDDTNVSIRYYEINFGNQEPKIERRTIESYVLSEKRAAAKNISSGSEITSGYFKINEVKQEKVEAECPSIFHRSDNIMHMTVEGTSRDFSYLEQSVILLGKGKIVQVREIDNCSSLETLVTKSENKKETNRSNVNVLDFYQNLPKGVKNYLTIMSVPTTAAIAGTIAYFGTSGLENINQGFITFISAVGFGIASGIYAGIKLGGI
jgi:hypothetical protein